MNLPYSHIFQFTVCKHYLIVITLKKHYIQSEVFFQVERFRAIATAKAQHARASQGRTTLAGDPNKKKHERTYQFGYHLSISLPSQKTLTAATPNFNAMAG